MLGAGQKRRNLRGPSYLQLLAVHWALGRPKKVALAYTRPILKVNAEAGLAATNCARSLKAHQVELDLLVSVFGSPQV